jgi:hypothetical protein
MAEGSVAGQETHMTKESIAGKGTYMTQEEIHMAQEILVNF